MYNVNLDIKMYVHTTAVILTVNINNIKPKYSIRGGKQCWKNVHHVTLDSIIIFILNDAHCTGLITSVILSIII